ncbi:MAG TPA: hypothetical protein VER33_26535 [Polyangiaceae bacterium]|nr:hypothetical protein [Polyangiaceae bacterium]
MSAPQDPRQVAPDATFRVCSTCRKPIVFGAPYYRCSVSTCNRARLALFFCSVPCWDAHVPGARHRDAWAEQAQAPTREQQQAAERAEREALARSADEKLARERRAATQSIGGNVEPQGEIPHDILLVVSKLKAYIRARSGFNTSDGVVDALSDHVRQLCDGAIERANAEGRKTVLDRDFKPLLKLGT